ncbi:MAG: hypothetical protein IKM26_09380 [Clostridia bacterium]|nr:hypothetical protein [Clostridia bacterium]
MITDNFLEEVATKRNRGMQSILMGVSVVLMVVMALYGMMGLNTVIYMFSGAFGDIPLGTKLFAAAEVLLSLGVAVVLFLFRDRIRTEYEYTFTNGQMDFAQVFNNKKRKNLGTMNIRNVEAMGLVASGSFNRYLNMKDVKRSNWFVNRDAQLFYFYFSKDNQKRMIIIEVSDEMLALIKRYAAQGTYQVN